MNGRVSVVAFAVAVSVAAPLASAGLILDELAITSTGLGMKMSGEIPANIYGSSTRIRISADDRRDMISTDDWFPDNSPGMSFDVTNGSGGSNVSRIDFQAGNNQIILFFDNGGFGEGGVVSGMIDFVLPGGSTWDIGAETTFRIKSTISSGPGTILFAGVDQSASTSTPCPAPWPSRPSPASLRFVADVADRDRTWGFHAIPGRSCAGRGSSCPLVITQRVV